MSSISLKILKFIFENFKLLWFFKEKYKRVYIKYKIRFKSENFTIGEYYDRKNISISKVLAILQLVN